MRRLLEGWTVLVVEDAEGLRDFARRLLERQGCHVVVASDAEEALTAFAQNPAVDLLLTDVVMPGLGGPELARRLRDRRPTLKVIYMSGYTEDTIVNRTVPMSGVGFLQKPFNADALTRKILELMTGSPEGPPVV